MKAEIKKRWLEALRSGNYHQAREKLRVSNGGCHGYCCLGVLCDIVAPNIGGSWCANSSFFDGLGENDILLPYGVWNYAGTTGNPTITFPEGHPVISDPRVNDIFNATGDRCLNLSALNDSGFSFAEIADLIEQFIPAE